MFVYVLELCKSEAKRPAGQSLKQPASHNVTRRYKENGTASEPLYMRKVAKYEYQKDLEWLCKPSPLSTKSH
jgi:hypothetical protein